MVRHHPPSGEERRHPAAERCKDFRRPVSRLVAPSFIAGHDPDTGEELWRTSTIALPGDPNDASWGDTPPYPRAGGDAWIPGSYDPELGLFYIGTAQAKPWVASSRGMTTRQDALYTNSTLALDPSTGQVRWYWAATAGRPRPTIRGPARSSSRCTRPACT